jgi:hypothetical protein
MMGTRTARAIGTKNQYPSREACRTDGVLFRKDAGCGIKKLVLMKAESDGRREQQSVNENRCW